jgi:uncharacterized protein YwqG
MSKKLPKVKIVYADNREISGASQFGGSATFIQADRTPSCCDSKMQLLAQLDSLDYPEAQLPDSAFVYVFICPHCFDVEAQMQCM